MFCWIRSTCIKWCKVWFNKGGMIETMPYPKSSLFNLLNKFDGAQFNSFGSAGLRNGPRWCFARWKSFFGAMFSTLLHWNCLKEWLHCAYMNSLQYTGLELGNICCVPCMFRGVWGCKVWKIFSITVRFAFPYTLNVISPERFKIDTSCLFYFYSFIK